MSGALISLVSKGPQDVYITNNEGDFSFFKAKYSRYSNFSQAPKLLNITGGAVQSGGTSIIQIDSFGDLINGMWLYGGEGVQSVIPGVDSPPGLIGCLPGTIFDLYIGGQLIDSQTFDYMSDIWSVYLAETATKRSMVNNFMVSNKDSPLLLDYTFVPLHFFFCDNEMFLPLLAIQYHTIEIRIQWGPYVSQAGSIQAYGNYIFLDTKERESMISKPMDILVTQVQRTVPNGKIDLSVFNHPVKSIYFGYPSVGLSSTWNFSSADVLLNGSYLLENMYPAYFHTVQGYYHTKNASIQFASDSNVHSPVLTQYYTYNFCLDATSYRPTGTCNFSRLDSASINLTQPVVKTVNGYSSLNTLTIYAVNYNVLRIKAGLAGIMFGN